MDSSWGGYPGIILPDNTLLYYLIPGDTDEDKYSDILGIDGVPMDIGMKRFYKDILYPLCRRSISTPPRPQRQRPQRQFGNNLRRYSHNSRMNSLSLILLGKGRPDKIKSKNEGKKNCLERILET